MIKRDSITLAAKNIMFGSANDEAAFFEWIDKLTCISRYEGKGDTLYIEVRSEAVNQSELRELLALFHRYGVDMKQLAIFDCEKFASWLRNENSYWFASVFATQ